MKKQFERLAQVRRGQWEILAAILIVVLGVSVFRLPFGSQGKLTYDSGKIRYQGHIVNRHMNGQGTLTFKNGDVYKGNFVNGTIDGQGTFVSKSGWTYKGQFKNGQADGQGTLTTASGKTYKGTFKQGIYQK